MLNEPLKILSFEADPEAWTAETNHALPKFIAEIIVKKLLSRLVKRKFVKGFLDASKDEF